MTAPAHVLAGVPLRHEPATVIDEWACTCGRIIAATSEHAARRIHDDHRAEQRQPDDHDFCPF